MGSLGLQAKYDFIISQMGSDFIPGAEYELRYQCPFCMEKGLKYHDYKLYVNYSKGKYFCQRCQASGINLFDETIAKGSNTDVYKLLEDFMQDDESSNSEEDSDYYLIPKGVPTPDTLAWDYLMRRGITPVDISNYSIRVSGLNDDRKFFGRIIIPNRVISNLWTDMYNARTYIDDDIRYKNPKSSKKTEIVFNLHRIPDNPEKIIINEGAINSIIAGPCSVASFGKYISDDQLMKILNKKPANIYVSLDTDARDKAEKLCNKIISLSDTHVYLVELPEVWDESKQKMKGLDASDLGREKYEEYLHSAREYVNKSIYIIDKYMEGLK